MSKHTYINTKFSPFGMNASMNKHGIVNFSGNIESSQVFSQPSMMTPCLFPLGLTSKRVDILWSDISPIVHHIHNLMVSKE